MTAEPHRHLYGLVPVWTKDGSAIESWWWCTDHPAGEWAKIEDEPDRPALPVPALSDAGLRPFVQHLYGCAVHTPLPEPWLAEPCTCPVKMTYGAHQVGCPRAAAFAKFMRKVDKEPRPACDCGLDAALALPVPAPDPLRLAAQRIVDAHKTVQYVEGTGLWEDIEALRAALEANHDR